MKSKVTGLNKVVRQLNDFGQEGERMAKAIVQSTADRVVLEAKRLAPANLGKLRQSIGKEEEAKGFVARIYAGERYSAYVEFGTGTYVNVPSELQALAIQYKGQKNGNFEQFLQAIRDWCRNKGIEEKASWVIAMSILRKGVRPQPFLYPAYVEGRKRLIQDIRKGLNVLVNKYNRK